MSNYEWHYQWIKELVHVGIPVESAQKAFKERIGNVENVNCEKDAVVEAGLFVQSRKAYPRAD